MPPGGASVVPLAAAEVLASLDLRYVRFHHRNRAYVRLLSFLAFVTLFMTVLFLQRSAGTSYQVFSTLSTGLLPADPITSTDDVYSWLQGLLHATWRDPTCGDGTCEAPFEYAAYGRFGCRADCGRLQDLQNLTALQIDMAWDFSHPAGSIPATELLSQASWNLCPANGPGTACYFAEDQVFDRLAGSTSMVIPDCPDGEWAVKVSHDLFDKVSGAVRIVPMMRRAALARKITIALAAAAAYRASEATALQVVVDSGLEPSLQVLNASLAAQHEAQLEDAANSLQQGVWDSATYLAHSAVLESTWQEQQAELLAVVAGCPGLTIYNASLAPVGSISQAVCDQYADATLAAEQERLAALQATIIGLAVPAQAAASTTLTQGLSVLKQEAPELHTIVAASTGQTASQPELASTMVLASAYIDGPGGTGLSPARAALTVRAITGTKITAAELAARAQARLDESAAVAAAVAVLPEVLLALNSSSLEYNYVAWSGSISSYQTCSLESRTPQYVGSCAPLTLCTMSTTADSNGSAQVTYTCPTTSLSSAACGDTCDLQALCSALCMCEDGCATDEVCMCSACTQVGSARQDPSFLEMQVLAGGSASLQGLGILGSSSVEEEGVAVTAGTRRRLRQSSTTDSGALADVLAAVAALEVSQAALAQDVQALQAQVQAASAASQDSTVLELISSGQAAIAAKQAAIQTALATILGQQSAAAEAAKQTVAALTSLQTLQAQQLEAQQAAAQAAAGQVTSIKLALQQGIISLSQALELFRRTRRQSLVAARESTLANVPCTSDPATEHAFTVDDYPDDTVNASRVRHVGLSNRIVAGLLLYAQRGTDGACPSARFDSLDGNCGGGLATAPYGVEATFKSGTASYDPSLADAATITSLYNCSALPVQTYNLSTGTISTATGQSATTNPPPYCAELYNPRSLPWGFTSFPLPGFIGTGYPAFVDINLSQQEAAAWAQFLQDGLYLDSHTRTLLAQVVTYNSQLRVFGSCLLSFDFGTGGTVAVSSRIQTLRVELYVTSGDHVRLALEVLLGACILFMVGTEVQEIWHTTRLYYNPFKHFHSFWQVLDFCSTGLLTATMLMWWSLVWSYSLDFRLDLRYDVYADLQAQAARLTLADGGAGLESMGVDFTRLQAISDSLAWYYALTGFNILLLIARLLQLLDFQPRLGVVTRSIAHAGPDLLHFGLVFALVFIGYSMMAHLIFGAAIERFSTFGRAVNTCFGLLLGDIDVNYDLEALTGLQGVAGVLFFWSFEVLVFLVLLSFLLAIVVDAFGIVKERTNETTGIHTELGQIIAHLWSVCLSRFRQDRLTDRELGRLLRWWRDNTATDPTTGDLNNDGVFDRADVLLEQERGRGRRRLRVGDRELSEEQLRLILQAYECEAEAEGDVESPTKRSIKRGLFSQISLRSPTFSSKKHLNPPPLDLDKAAHYAMLRFGETPASTTEEQEHQGSPRASHGSGSDCAPSAGAGAGTSSKAAAATVAATAGAGAGAADYNAFTIAALRLQGPASPPQAGVGASPGGTNGQQLVATIRLQTEQRGVDDAVLQLLQLQRGLASQQATVLEAQAVLASQQGALLAAAGSEGASGAPADAPAAAGGGAGLPRAGSLPHAVSLRERWSPSFKEPGASSGARGLHSVGSGYDAPG